jgi:hypothetical protein
MNIGTIRDPNSGEVFADIDDLIALFKDAREHPDKYDEIVITRLAEEATGKKKVEAPIERPF